MYENTVNQLVDFVTSKPHEDTITFKELAILLMTILEVETIKYDLSISKELDKPQQSGILN